MLPAAGADLGAGTLFAGDAWEHVVATVTALWPRGRLAS
jgi:hypothetical protein